MRIQSHGNRAISSPRVSRNASGSRSSSTAAGGQSTQNTSGATARNRPVRRRAVATGSAAQTCSRPSRIPRSSSSSRSAVSSGPQQHFGLHLSVSNRAHGIGGLGTEGRGSGLVGIADRLFISGAFHWPRPHSVQIVRHTPTLYENLAPAGAWATSRIARARPGLECGRR